MQTSSKKSLTPQKLTGSCCYFWLSLGHFLPPSSMDELLLLLWDHLYYHFFAGNAFLCIWLCLISHQGILEKIKTPLHCNCLKCIYIDLLQSKADLANPGATVLSFRLHSPSNGLRPKPTPPKKAPAYLSAETAYLDLVMQRNSGKMLLFGWGTRVVVIPWPLHSCPSSLYITLPSASIWPVMLLPFFIKQKT